MNDVKRDNERNISLYTDLLNEHGDDYKALNWGSQASQRLRFKILAEIGVVEGDSVLDVGCGIGDLYDWFSQSDFSIDYSGIDLTPGMVSRAQQRFPAVKFSTGSIDELDASQLGTYDFVLASGVFAHRQSHANEFLQHSIQQMFAIAGKGMAFNCLSSWREDRDEGEFYADPVETLEYCRSLSKRILLRHDYHPGDFTIYLYREDSQE